MLHLTSVDLKKAKIETLAIPVCEDKDIHDDKLIKALIKKAMKLKEFNGKKDQGVTLYDLPDVNARRVVLQGLGKLEKIDCEALRSMAGKTVTECIKNELSNVWIVVPEAKKINLEIPVVLEAMQEGAYLGNHIFDKYKGDKKKKVLNQINFVASPAIVKKFGRLPSQVTTVCQGTILAREWVSTPSNEKTPVKLTRSIVSLAKKARLKVHILTEKELKQKKFGALLAVAAGSQSKPSLVVLQHTVKGAKKTVALVGKGVTFDSGGLNLKTGSSMAGMKADMSGAAAVAATLISVAKLKKKTNIIGAIPIVENMPSGMATRPGDIVKSFSGKSVEIGNTDAEGRLILIDAMSYVIKKYKPQILIDLATLTGACMVALGEKIAGVFSNDDTLARAIVESGEKTQERCWHMPLPDDYKDLLKSDFADLNNISSTRWGGAITAALFLSEFVEDTRWAHIDIAGPAYINKASAYCGPGGTGFGVRLLMDIFDKI
ncbi:MAG: leucyl aminopeptidase [Desulfobacterales bacterium]|nr:MAG: leucyl aminopeptidase [Desulfobacterales bacterium]